MFTYFFAGQAKYGLKALILLAGFTAVTCGALPAFADGDKVRFSSL